MMLRTFFLKFMRVTVAGGFCLICALPLWAATVPDCEAIAARIGAAEGLPEGLLPAISRIEAGRKMGKSVHAWPWTLNHAGKGLFFETQAAALAYLRKTVADGPRNIDVGCMQINNYWHGKQFASLEAMIDPETNVRYAVRYLKQLYSEKGSWDAAVRNYHSPDPERGARYHRAFSAARGRMSPDANGTELMQVTQNGAVSTALTGREAMMAGGLFGMSAYIRRSDMAKNGGNTATENAYAALLALLDQRESEGISFKSFAPDLAETSTSRVLQQRWTQVEAFRAMLAPTEPDQRK